MDDKFLPARRNANRVARAQSKAHQEMAEPIIMEVKAKKLMAKGIVSYFGDVMNDIAELDDHRGDLAHGNVSLDLILSGLERTCINKVNRLGNSMFETFD